MSVHFHLMTVSGNRTTFLDSSDQMLTMPDQLGFSNAAFNSESSGVHWASNFPATLGLSAEEAEESEGTLWRSDAPEATFKLAYLIGRVTQAMQTQMLPHSGYGSRTHHAQLLSLLQMAQAYTAVHYPLADFVICWH